MPSPSPDFSALRHGLIVSCQAPARDPFADAHALSLFARAAVQGGAVAIRAEGADSIRAIRRAVTVPIIGIKKRTMDDGKTLITPSDAEAAELAAAGANMVALDCSRRGQAFGALARIRFIKEQLGVSAWADISTIDEARAAAAAGADAILSTLRGYTAETMSVSAFDERFIAELVEAVAVPVIAEGRISTVAEARAAVASGAFAVVVGTAITRPEEITRKFSLALADCAPGSNRHILGIDLGGTNTKAGIATMAGQLQLSTSRPTPHRAGQAGLFTHLIELASDRIETAKAEGIEVRAIGVATAGWVDPLKGEVLYATDNLAGWTGAPVVRRLSSELNLPVAVENDANALAVAERHFGAGRNVDDFVCVTLGTGVGGGCYVNGRLQRGAHHLANALGHIIVKDGGRRCSCGQLGCLEAYANAEALLNYANGEWTSAQDLIAAANAGDITAARAVETLAHWLALGCRSVISVLDPQLLIFSGGIAQNNRLLVSRVTSILAASEIAAFRKIQAVESKLGYHGGVLGAIAVGSGAIA